MDLRRNVRAPLRACITLQGNDRSGRPFEIQAASVDFSRRGLGLILDRDVFAAGSVVTARMPGKFHSRAVVQWSRPDPAHGRVRVGLSLLDPQASRTVRLVACALLCLALCAQISLGRSRSFSRPIPSRTCTVSLERMRAVLESGLKTVALVTESDKAFVHIQHQHSSCADYTRLFEKSRFYRNPEKDRAVARWHWDVYHATDVAVREAAIRSLEPVLREAR
jgi:hypothetical protein